MSSVEEKKVVALSLSIFLLLPVLSAIGPYVRYGCGNCDVSAQTMQGYDPTYRAASTVSDATILQGDEKETAISRAIDSESFRMLDALLADFGYRKTAEDAVAVRFTKTFGAKPFKCLAVGINFTGDLESRQVMALVFLEPYEEAAAYRLDLRRNLIELLARATGKGITGGKLAADGYKGATINNHFLINDCPSCQFTCAECYEWSYDCFMQCCEICRYLGWPLWCILLWCPACFYICCTHSELTCCQCNPPATCYQPECLEPGCGC